MAQCHLCRTSGADSQEHVPPQAAGNHGAWDIVYRELRAKGAPLRTLRAQGGYWRPTLCTSCNNDVTSRYVPAYASLAAAVRASATVGGRRLVHLSGLDGRRILKAMVGMLIATPPYEPDPRWEHLEGRGSPT